MRAARDETDVGAGACKLHAHQAAYRSRSEDADLHDAAPVTMRSRLPMPRVAGHDGGSLIEHRGAASIQIVKVSRALHKRSLIAAACEARPSHPSSRRSDASARPMSI